MAKDCWLKRRREELDMSQHDVAIALGMTAGAIGQWERFISAPPVRLTPKMAQVYKASEEKIVEGILEIVHGIDSRKLAAAK